MSQKRRSNRTQRLAHEALVLTEEATTLTREVVTAPFRLRTYRLIRKIIIGFILVSIANVLISYFFNTPKMYRNLRDNPELCKEIEKKLRDLIETAHDETAPVSEDEPYSEDE